MSMGEGDPQPTIEGPFFPTFGDGSSFSRRMQGYREPTAGPHVKSLPKPGEVWLSYPPYLMLARIVEVDVEGDPPVVSYKLHDDDGSLLTEVEHAQLDRGWWQAFQRLERRFG
jgi:hypothetical protein